MASKRSSTVHRSFTVIRFNIVWHSSVKCGLGENSSLGLISLRQHCICSLENREGLRLSTEHTATTQLSHSKAWALLSGCGDQLSPSLKTIITIIQWWGLCCVTDVSAVFIRGWDCVSGKPWNNHIAKQESCLSPLSCLSQISVHNTNCFTL